MTNKLGSGGRRTREAWKESVIVLIFITRGHSPSEWKLANKGNTASQSLWHIRQQVKAKQLNKEALA